MIEIVNRYTRDVLYSSATANTIAEAVAEAVKARAYLAGAYLAGAYLVGAYLAGANLAGADLVGAYLAGANLAGANLAGANLADANLTDANLVGANLADANLTDANLAGAKNILRISGGRHDIVASNTGLVSIGCHTYLIERWTQSYTTIGTKEGYSLKEIEDYGERLKLVAAWVARQQKKEESAA